MNELRKHRTTRSLNNKLRHTSCYRTTLGGLKTDCANLKWHQVNQVCCWFCSVFASILSLPPRIATQPNTDFCVGTNTDAAAPSPKLQAPEKRQIPSSIHPLIHDPMPWCLGCILILPPVRSADIPVRSSVRGRNGLRT